MRSKAEPATTRIKRLLELLSVYSFNLFYNKRKDMVLSDFLSRQKSDDSNLHEIIPISFSIRSVLHESYYGLGSLKKFTDSRTDNYMVQTRAQVKSSSIKLLEVHGAKKNLVPHMKPENLVKGTCPITPACHLRPIHHIPHTNQELPTNTLPPIPKPRIGQGKAGIRSKPRVAPPVPESKQMPFLPIPEPTPREAIPLTELVTQSQGSILP